MTAKKSQSFSRRDALKLGASAVVPTIAGCTEGSTDTDGQDPPEPEKAEITHIVVVMMENRSYDHFLGSRKLAGLPGDGIDPDMANDDLEGVSQAVYRESIASPCVADPPHGWDASHAQFNSGMNDGFLSEYQNADGAGAGPHVMGYFTADDLPVTHALADNYAVCDRWFASVMGPTWPNRFYLHAAQSGGLKSNDSPKDPLPTIYDSLDKKGIPWGYYYTDLPFLLILGNTNIKPAVPSFFDDAKNGTLPPVTVVDPGFALNDDHPPHHPLLGQQFIASIYQALATSPLWEKVLMVLIYDEHGGFFDHVAPPKTADDRASEGFDQLGFRIPAIAIGPWVKKGHVSSVVRDHTSVLKHIENMFGLDPLTARDAAANDLSELIDTERMEKNEPEPPVTLPSVDIDASAIDPACKTKVRSQKCDIEILADNGGIPFELDLRPRARETAFFIGDYLEAHGIGSIRGPR